MSLADVPLRAMALINEQIAEIEELRARATAAESELARLRGELAGGWRTMDSAPKDGTPILGWCVHEADRYHIEETDRLTDYGCHVEGLGRVENGPHVLVWGGGDSDFDEWSGRTLVWPDWWFRAGSEFEQAANPVMWMPISPPGAAPSATIEPAPATQETKHG